MKIVHLTISEYGLLFCSRAYLNPWKKYLKHIDYIYTEVNTEEVYKGCDSIGSIDSYLKQFGFEKCDLRIYNQFDWGDAFYIKQK